MTGISLLGYLVYLSAGVSQSQPGVYSVLTRATVLRAFQVAARKALEDIPDAADRARGAESVKQIAGLADQAFQAVPPSVLAHAGITGRLTDSQIADLVALFG